MACWSHPCGGGEGKERGTTPAALVAAGAWGGTQHPGARGSLPTWALGFFPPRINQGNSSRAAPLCAPL